MKDSKNLVIGMLCAVVCIMAVAYAAFSTTLTINGTASIESNWCVRIKDTPTCTTTPVTGGDVASVVANVTKNSDSLATVEMKFAQPGDTATCTITYENCGTLDAELTHTVTGINGLALEDGQTVTENGAIRFTITGAIPGNDGKIVLLKDGGSHNVIVKGEYLTSVTTEPEASAKNATLQIISTATQKMS